MLCFSFLQLEEKVNEIEHFYSTLSKKQGDTSKVSSATKDKDKDKYIPSIKKQQQDAVEREAAAAKRMQDLMRQCGTIIRQAMNLFAFIHKLVFL